MYDVCVVGQGHIGLPTAVTFASVGLDVLGVDVQSDLVDELNRGRTHLAEPGLEEALRQVLESGRYRASTEVAPSQAFIVSVPTPLDREDRPILTHVMSAAAAIAPNMTPGALVVLESTVSPGTTAGAFRTALAAGARIASFEYMVAHCPERVLPGRILHELVHNDRVVGGLTDEAARGAVELYRRFVEGDIVVTDATTAEMVKLSENIYRDVNIALANELAMAAESLGIDGWRVIEIANRHPRVNIHQPGPGVGGYCIPVASLFLGAATDTTMRTIGSARQTNIDQPERAAAELYGRLRAEGIDEPVIAVMGVAYKGNVVDARATPADDIIAALTKLGATVRVHDPLATNSRHELLSAEDALRGADAAMFITDHDRFRTSDPEAAALLMRHRVVFDGRNVLPANEWRKAGFRVLRLGDGSPISGR